MVRLVLCKAARRFLIPYPSCPIAVIKRIVNSVRVRVRRSIGVPLRTRRTAIKAQREWSSVSVERLMEVRERTLWYVSKMAVKEEGVGRYRYKDDGPSLLYASCYAALTLHLCGELQKQPRELLEKWGEYLAGFQSEDGLFRDPRIQCELAENCDWWGWRHLTLHSLMALCALGQKCRRPFRVLDSFRQPGSVQKWLEGRNWREDTCGVSNEVQNIGRFMQYARDYLGETIWEERLTELYDWLDRHQDPASGLWGVRFDSPRDLSLGIQSAYHFWMLYKYDGRPVLHRAQALDSCFRSQTHEGGFGFVRNTSACEDIDSIDPIARLAQDPDQNQAQRIMRKAMPWVLAHQNEDGGWVFRRHEKFQ